MSISNATTTNSAPRNLSKRLMLWLRRAHLYLGLLLFPWAVLYGVTGYLFNHPTHFADAPIQRFGKSLLAGTPLSNLPSLEALSEQIVHQLNQRDDLRNRYSLDTTVPPKFANAFLFGRQDRKDTTLSFLLNVAGTGGTIRVQSKPVPPTATAAEPAPFATPVESSSTIVAQVTNAPAAPPLTLEPDLEQTVLATMRMALPKLGESDVSNLIVTSIPDLVFVLRDGDRRWTAKYNPLKGTIVGQPTVELDRKAPTIREFLLRLHAAHGFPDEQNAMWWWAVIVDLMSAVLIGWGITGLLMWWQVKSTRTWGFMALAAGAASAFVMGYAMLQAM